ncbi:MAG TPA: hypothetical protein VGN97_18505 [Mesorhizobium sp.]|jgi:hypothetical protein|nr:hypothetical protein [Mesorhizobium sp.]
MADGGAEPPTASTVEAELRAIATQFKKFSESLSPLTTIPRTVEEFEDILVEWLLYVEAFSEKNLDFKFGTKTDASGKLRQYVDVPATTSLRDEEQFLSARFVQHALQTDKNSAEVLARIASIGLLTEVVQDFVKPITAIDETNLVVYLDAPVALELLGVSGRAARENTAPVVAELIRIGASVRIFGQSTEEMKKSLQAVLRNTRPTGPTAQAMIRKEVLRDYVVQVAQDPVPILDKHGVKLAQRTLEQTPSEHQYFTLEDRSEIYAALRYAENPHARDHDANITTFVMRQRRGKHDRDLFKSSFIVLTRNGLLAQLAQRKCAELGRLPGGMVPPVIHRRVLATAMWLRTGMGASDLNVPKRMLLASCERVLALRPGVVEAAKRLTDALGDEEKARQLDLLVSQDRSAQALMDKTLGASNVVTAENLPLLFEEMLHPHLDEERRKGETAVKEARAQGRKQLDKAKEQLQAAENKQSAAAARLDAKLQEDRDAVEALSEEVAKDLAKRRRLRKLGAVRLALASCIPVALETSTVTKLATIFIGWLFAYLTLTGGRLIGTGTDERTALEALRSAASTRRLATKLDQFDVQWEDARFIISERPVATVTQPSSDLFEATPVTSAVK